MSSTTLVLSSLTARKYDPTNRPENFTTLFTPTLAMNQKKQYEIALVSFQASYSWYNVRASYGNNTFSYYNGVATVPILIPDGVYSYSDLNSLLHFIMKENGDVNFDDTYNINISFNVSTFQVVLEIVAPFTITIPTEFGKLLGFSAGTYSGPINLSDFTPNITRDIDTVYIHCSIVSDASIDGRAGDTIFTFSTANLNRSYSFSFEPNNLMYFPMNSPLIQRVTMRVTDAIGNIIDLNGVDTSYTLTIREVR
jgi:hypothetical protein